MGWEADLLWMREVTGIWVGLRRDLPFGLIYLLATMASRLWGPDWRVSEMPKRPKHVRRRQG